MQQLDLFDKITRAANTTNSISFTFQTLYTLGTYLHYLFPNVFDFINGVTFYNYNKQDYIDFQDNSRFRQILNIDNEKLYPNDFYLKLLNLYNIISLTYKLDACYFTGSQKSNIFSDLENIKDTQYCLFSSMLTENLDRVGNLDTSLNFLTVFFQSENVVVFSFSGSNSIKKWIADFMTGKSIFLNPKEMQGATKRPILFHHGFISMLSSVLRISASQLRNHDFGLQKSVDSTVIEFVMYLIKSVGDENTKFYFIGHSLGGSLATICFLKVKASLLCEKCTRSENSYLYAYGCPKLSNIDMESEVDLAALNIDLNKIVFVVNDNDLVPKFPPHSFDYYSTYVTSFPSRQLRLQSGSQSSYFNLISGVLNHNKYADALKAFYKGTLYKS